MHRLLAEPSGPVPYPQSLCVSSLAPVETQKRDEWDNGISRGGRNMDDDLDGHFVVRNGEVCFRVSLLNVYF